MRSLFETRQDLEKFNTRFLEHNGCEIAYSPGSASDPGGGPMIFIRNVGKKLVRVGEKIFLEPGEKATIPYDPAVEIVALNNGV